MIRYRRSLGRKRCGAGAGKPEPGRNGLHSGGSTSASLKLKEIDGRTPPGVEPAA
jgi:hypothetical protein